MNLEVTDHLNGFDLCVVGGGMAGYCAALAAAREGARTILVHNRPVLGGCGSTEMRIPYSGAGSHNPSANETGLILELITEERAQSPDHGGDAIVNAGWDLLLYDKVRREPNLTALLNTQAYEVRMEGDRLAAVIALQPDAEKLWQIEADFFVDATGDGTVGLAAGVPFRVGQEARDEYGEDLAPAEAETWTLGSSLIFRSRDCGRPMPYTPPPWAASYPTEESLSHRPHGRIEGGYWWIEVGYPFDSIGDTDAIRDELLRHVLAVWDHIKNHCEHRERATNLVLEWVGMLPAKRESRRFVGAHVLTQTEIARRELFEDRVAYGGWIIDDHTKGGILAQDQAPSFHGTGFARFYVAPYSVPLRSLHAANVPNLFFAGRCMSASRLAFNSLRVQRTLAVGGQAVGTAAAHCAQAKRSPADLQPADLYHIQQSLLRQDCWIPRVRNEDANDLARQATVTASSTWAYEALPSERGLALGAPLACLLPMSQEPEQVRVFLRNEGEKDRAVQGTLHEAEDIWDLPALEREPVAAAEFVVPAHSSGAIHGAAEWRDGSRRYRGLYWLKLSPAHGVTWLQQSWAPPGITSAHHEEGRWAFAPGQFTDWRPLAADVLPAARAYEPENATNGVSRPEQWPNVWLSHGPAPQWLRLDLAEPVEISQVQIAWGLNFHRSYFQMPGCFRAPECARDYRIVAIGPDGQDRVWAEVEGNYQRLCRHDRPDDLTGAVAAVMIQVLATNGADRVEIDDVRIY